MRIDLLGAEFNIKSDQDPEYLEEVLEVYRSRIEEIRATVGTSDPLKIAILAGILTADGYLRQTGMERTNQAEAAKITIGLITELEAALGEESSDTTSSSTADTDPNALDPK